MIQKQHSQRGAYIYIKISKISIPLYLSPEKKVKNRVYQIFHNLIYPIVITSVFDSQTISFALHALFSF